MSQLPQRDQTWSAKKLREFVIDLQEKWESGLIKCPLHLPGGNEHQLLKIFQEMGDHDYVFSTHRNLYHALLHGVSADRLLTEITKRSPVDIPEALCQGHSGSMCTCDHSKRFYSSAIVGGVCAIAAGVAYGLKKRKAKERVWAFIGDGAVDQGHFYEALCWVESQDLPLTFVIEDNDRSTCSSYKDRFGEWNSATRTAAISSPKCWYYSYDPVYPHVGSGKYVQF